VQCGGESDVLMERGMDNKAVTAMQADKDQTRFGRQSQGSTRGPSFISRDARVAISQKGEAL
jgi:hypothetical protein